MQSEMDLHVIDGLRAKVKELQIENMAVKDMALAYRDGLSRLFDHAAEVRGYADGWEWKYGAAWDEEMNIARNLLDGCQAGS